MVFNLLRRSRWYQVCDGIPQQKHLVHEIKANMVEVVHVE